MKLDRPSLRITVVVLSWCFALKAKAFYSVMETGDLLSEGSYRASIESQFLSEGDRGINLLGRIDSWFNQDANIKAVIGAGTTDFITGGFFKWVPYPDSEGQPAIGLTSGVVYARYEDIDEISLRIQPLVSKKFSTEVGDMNPYMSIPFGVASRDSKKFTPIQLVGGLEWKTEQWTDVTFIGEFGINLNQAFSYLSLGVAVNWDSH